mgnify:FL=1
MPSLTFAVFDLILMHGVEILMNADCKALIYKIEICALCLLLCHVAIFYVTNKTPHTRELKYLDAVHGYKGSYCLYRILCMHNMRVNFLTL